MIMTKPTEYLIMEHLCRISNMGIDKPLLMKYGEAFMVANLSEQKHKDED